MDWVRFRYNYNGLGLDKLQNPPKPPIKNTVYAAIQALQEAQTRLELREGCVCKVLILTDSSYLVKGISEWIWKWKANGYRNSRNQPVVNGNLFVWLNELVYVFESQDIPVWLRHVRREFNQAADALRNQFSNC